MTLLEAVCLYTTKSDVSMYPERRELLHQAREIVNAEKGRLYGAASAKLNVIDVQIYENSPYDPARMWMRHLLSNGTATKELVTRECAGYVKAAFVAGMKAGQNSC